MLHIKIKKEEIKEQIRKRNYKPGPVRRVDIPKENGDKRSLEIPTVVDRVLQQAIVKERNRIHIKLLDKYNKLRYNILC